MLFLSIKQWLILANHCNLCCKWYVIILVYLCLFLPKPISTKIFSCFALSTAYANEFQSCMCFKPCVSTIHSVCLYDWNIGAKNPQITTMHLYLEMSLKAFLLGRSIPGSQCKQKHVCRTDQGKKGFKDCLKFSRYTCSPSGYLQALLSSIGIL